MGSLEGRLRKVEKALGSIVPGSHPSVYEGMPSPTGFPHHSLTGKALNDWVRNTTPGGDTIAGRLAAAYLHAALATPEEEMTPGWDFRADGPDPAVLANGERALRDLESEIRLELAVADALTAPEV